MRLCLPGVVGVVDALAVQYAGTDQRPGRTAGDPSPVSGPDPDSIEADGVGEKYQGKRGGVQPREASRSDQAGSGGPGDERSLVAGGE